MHIVNNNSSVGLPLRRIVFGLRCPFEANRFKLAEEAPRSGVTAEPNVKLNRRPNVTCKKLLALHEHSTF